MKNFYKLLSVIFLMIVVFGCHHQKQIIVYGSSQCPHCTSFIKQLDSAKLTYQFKDFMEPDNKYDEEMLNKLNKFGYRGYVYLPVVDIEGKMFVKANIKEVSTEALKN